MKNRSALLAALLLLSVAAACGDSSSDATAGGDAPDPAAGACLVGTEDCVDADLDPDDAAGPSAGMCAPGVTDCVDAVVEPGGDEFPVEAAIEDAQALLGVDEGALPDDVRVSRRGDEQLPMTDDYVLGRRTVELEDDGSGYRVVAVTVELPDGPETFSLQAD